MKNQTEHKKNQMEHMKNQTQLCKSDLSFALDGFVTLQYDLNIYCTIYSVDNWRLDTGVMILLSCVWMALSD
jgi:hypothetical protein